MIEIKGLSYEQNKKYHVAIERGYFKNYEAEPKKWRHSFIGAYVWKHPGRIKVLDLICSVIGHEPEWQDMTDTNLKDFVDELFESGMAPSSMRTVCAELKAVLNDNVEHEIPSERFNKILSVKGQISQAVYLTREEVERLAIYTPRSYVEQYVLRNFMIESLTGARKEDAKRLTINNCNHETGLLTYVPQKTPNIVVSVPVDERMGLRQFLADDYKRECCDDVFNETIRTICRESGINEICTLQRRGEKVTEPKWKLVSSHTGRRSFATNLWLAGVSLEEIALMMGHGKNIETTKRYICSERKLSANVMSYFQPQKLPRYETDE